MTALTCFKKASRRLISQDQGSLFTGNDPFQIKFLEIMSEAIQDIAQAHDWNDLSRNARLFPMEIRPISLCHQIMDGCSLRLTFTHRSGPLITSPPKTRMSGYSFSVSCRQPSPDTGSSMAARCTFFRRHGPMRTPHSGIFPPNLFAGLMER